MGIDQALEKLAAEHDAMASVGWNTGDPRYAAPAVCPLSTNRASQPPCLTRTPGACRAMRSCLLAGLLLIFPSKTNLRRFNNAANIKKRHRPLDGYRTDIVTSTGGRRPSGRGPCACAAPQLVAKIQNAEYPAEPSEQMGPAATLFRAECRACGRRYVGTWRRIGSAPVPRQRGAHPGRPKPPPSDE